MSEKNLRNEAYNIVMSFIDETAIKEIDYDEMTWRGKWVIELASWKIMWIDFRVVFYEMGHPCAYIRVPEQCYELTNILKTEWYDWIPIQTCHWGFTFWQFTEEWDTRGFWKWLWIGWDYWHYWDYAGYYKDSYFKEEFRKRTTTDILIEVVEQILALKEWGYLYT